MMLPDLPVADERTDELVRLELDGLPERIDLAEVFGNPRPVELEIGVGKGRFLLLAAAARPDVNYLGLEVARRYAEKAIDRVGKRGLRNVRIALAEAGQVLGRRLPDDGLAGCHVYFPDPWPKKRHHKRRLLRADVVTDLARVIRSGGLLRVVTDHPDYAAWIRELMPAQPEFEEMAHEPSLWELPGMGDYTRVGVTNFEIKYRREGRPLHRWVWRRR
jgi:tRNA (guanine-N7-)-methyltransferase